MVCEDFRAAVAGSDREDQVIPEAELNKILNHLPHLQNLNQELLNDFESRIRQWRSNPRISDVIVRKGPFLKLYSAYIRDFSAQCSLLDECIAKYPRFGAALRQFEMSDRCKMLPLKTYLLKPIQRVPQYKLLLETYLRHLSQESVDYTDSIVALKIVTEVADHANNKMKYEVIVLNALIIFI